MPRNVYFFEKQMRLNAGIIELSQSAEKTQSVDLAFLVPLVHHFHTEIETNEPNNKRITERKR